MSTRLPTRFIVQILVNWTFFLRLAIGSKLTGVWVFFFFHVSACTSPTLHDRDDCQASGLKSSCVKRCWHYSRLSLCLLLVLLLSKDIIRCGCRVVWGDPQDSGPIHSSWRALYSSSLLLDGSHNAFAFVFIHSWNYSGRLTTSNSITRTQ